MVEVAEEEITNEEAEEEGITGKIIIFWTQTQYGSYDNYWYVYHEYPAIEDDYGNQWLLSSSDMKTTYQYGGGIRLGGTTTIKGYTFSFGYGKGEKAENGWDWDWWICGTGKRVRVTGTITENTSGYGYEKMNRISVKTIEELD
jgi:hypothetical protein